MPFFIQAFLPFGPYTLSNDTESFEVKESYYRYQPHVSKLSGSPVSTRVFLDDESSFCSAILHANVNAANHPDQLGGDFSILHNPRARCPLDTSMLSWCEQLMFSDDRLHRLP